jgi:surface antigen
MEQPMTFKALTVAAFALSLMSPSLYAEDNGLGGALGGGLLGGAGGGLLGKAVGGEDGAAIGAAIGAVLGSLLAELSAVDQQKRNDAAAQAETAPIGATTSWASAEAGTSGTLVKTSEVYEADGRKCMNVKETVSIKGKAQEVDGVQCLVDGKWVASN